MPSVFIPDLDLLLAEVREGATLIDSTHHGEQHWLAVARTGLEIRRADDQCDRKVLFLFALLHDARRELETRDPEHGPRAAGLALTLRERALFGIDDARMALLMEACQLHDTGAVSDEPSIGACYDADRLNLARLGITPDPSLLSRPVSRDPEFIARCAAFDSHDLSWEQLHHDLVG
jgi:uncharacterized protein